MAERLPNEAAVSAAVDRLLTAGLSGDDAADAMALLIAETSLLPVNNLDRWERLIRTNLWAFQSKPTSIWQRLRGNRTGFASWLDLCNGDGFRRERILRTLNGAAPNGFLLAFAIRRLNDWVPQVRAAAREHLPSLAARSDPKHVVDALWHVLGHCDTWGRMEVADRQALALLIRIEPIAVELCSRILAATSGPVAKILSQAGRVPALDHSLKEIASAAIQPSVRAMACRFLLDGRMSWVVGRKWRWTDLKWCKGRFEPVIEERAIAETSDFLSILRMALADRSALVRRVAAEFLIKELSSIGNEAANLAEKLAADPSAYVAERGRFAMASLISAREQRTPGAT
jgi:hypothetical protein